MDSIGGISIALFTRELGMNRMDVEVLLASVKKDLKNRNVHACYHM